MHYAWPMKSREENRARLFYVGLCCAAKPIRATSDSKMGEEKERERKKRRPQENPAQGAASQSRNSKKTEEMRQIEIGEDCIEEHVGERFCAENGPFASGDEENAGPWAWRRSEEKGLALSTAKIRSRSQNRTLLGRP